MTIQVDQIVRDIHIVVEMEEGNICLKEVQLLTLAFTQISLYSFVSNIGVYIGTDGQKDM